MAGRIFLANVGVNASHAARSPLFPDGSFEFVPIPESTRSGAPPMRRYRDLPSFNTPEQSLDRYVPARLYGAWVHDDPEFVTLTYGDTCQRSPRAAALKSIETGDYLFFLARLSPFDHSFHSSSPGFYLIGYLHISQVIADISSALAPAVLQRLERNAHVRQSLAPGGRFDGYWVFCGSAQSRRFRIAVPFTRSFAHRVLRDAQGQLLRWPPQRSELQVIGSYTRSCRRILDPARRADRSRVAFWWHYIAAFNPEAAVLNALDPGATTVR